jgi:hypothetical protein
MKRLLYIFIFAFAGLPLFSQVDSVQYSGDFALKEGVYFSYGNFRRNDPVPKEDIDSKGDKSQLDFISKTINENKDLSITNSGVTSHIETKRLWGYCQNNALYLNFEGKFYRVPVFGNISQFLGTVEVYNYNNYGMYGMYGYGMMGGASMPVKQREVRQYLFDFYTGDIMDYTLTNVEILISRDLKLYEEFMQMKKRKRRDMMMLYIRKYNAAHPISFPVAK